MPNPYAPGRGDARDPDKAHPANFDPDAPAVRFATQLTDDRYDEIRRIPAGAMPLFRLANRAMLGMCGLIVGLILVVGILRGQFSLAILAVGGFFAFGGVAWSLQSRFVVRRLRGIDYQAACYRGLVGDLRGEISDQRVYLEGDDEGFLIPSESIASIEWFSDALQIRIAANLMMEFPRTRFSIPREAFEEREETVFPMTGSLLGREFNHSLIDWQPHIDWLFARDNVSVDDVFTIDRKVGMWESMQDKSPFRAWMTRDCLYRAQGPLIDRTKGPHGLDRMHWSDKGVVIEIDGQDDELLIPRSAIPEADHPRVQQWLEAR